MTKQFRFRFIRRWQDLDWIFEAGAEITLLAKDVAVVRERMGIYGETADLCSYGYHVIPLSYLEEVKEESVYQKGGGFQ